MDYLTMPKFVFFKKLPVFYILNIDRIRKDIWLLFVEKINELSQKFQAIRMRLAPEIKEIGLKKREGSKRYIKQLIAKLRAENTKTILFLYGKKRIPLNMVITDYNDLRQLNRLIQIMDMYHSGELNMELVGNEYILELNLSEQEIKEKYMEYKAAAEEFNHIADEMRKIYNEWYGEDD